MVNSGLICSLVLVLFYKLHYQFTIHHSLYANHLLLRIVEHKLVVNHIDDDGVVGLDFLFQYLA